MTITQRDAALEGFRFLADAMIGKADWEWVGPYMSQRHFGITQERAEGYAKALRRRGAEDGGALMLLLFSMTTAAILLAALVEW